MNEGTWGHSTEAGFEGYFMVTFKDHKLIKAFIRYLDKTQTGHQMFLGTDGKPPYEGEESKDISFLINYKNYERIANDLMLPSDVMLVGSCDARDRRPASALDRLTGRVTPLGYLRSVSPDQAKSVGQYCVNPNGTHFIIEQRWAQGALQTEALAPVG
jgi:hypothetical protein